LNWHLSYKELQKIRIFQILKEKHIGNQLLGLRTFIKYLIIFLKIMKNTELLIKTDIKKGFNPFFQTSTIPRTLQHKKNSK